MSLYCSGKGVVNTNAGFIRYHIECKMMERCMRHKAFVDYKNNGDPTHTGMSTVLWLVNVSDCIHRNYEDGVFEKGEEK